VLNLAGLNFWRQFRTRLSSTLSSLQKGVTMLKPMAVIVLILSASHCLAQASRTPKDSPAVAFDHFANGIQRTDYKNYVRAQSLSKKKLLLLSAIQAVSLYHEDEFGKLCEKHAIPFQQMLKSCNGTDTMLNTILRRRNVNGFIYDMLKISEEANRNDHDIENRLKLNESTPDRAVGIHQVYLDNELSFTTPIHFRRYLDRWTVCTEDEWRNESSLINLDVPQHRR